MHIDGDTSLDKFSHRALHVQGVPPKAIHCVDANHIPRPNLLQQLSKTWTIGSHHTATHPLVAELLAKCATHRMALCLDTLIGSGDAKVGYPHEWLKS